MSEKFKENPKIETDLISLRKATKYCDYSGDYLKLRARQGKLKAVKIGKMWATKKEWVQDYIRKMEGYKESAKIGTDLISLTKATKYCGYSGDYLKLRARQGKLKAVKIGRVWATKREWVENYVREMEEFKENRRRQGEVKLDVKEREVKEVRPIRRISLFPEFELRPALALALILLLLFSSIALSKETFKNILQDTIFYVQQTPKTITHVLKESKKSLASSLDSLNQSFINVAQVIKTTDYEDFKTPTPLFKEYFKWLGNSLKTVFVQKPKALVKSILNYGRYIAKKIRKAFKNLALEFQTKTKELKELITKPWKIIPKKPPKEPEKPILAEVTREEFEKLKQEIERIKEEGLPVREVVKEIEVSRITKVEPIKEITKEIKILDDESLRKIQTALLQQETDVGKLKLAASLGYVRLPTILSPSGDISIITLGTITTGTWQGISIADEYITNDLTLSSLGVSGSTTLGGSSSDTLTVNATSSFNGLLTANEQLLATKAPTEAHTGTWSVDSGTWQADDATIYINPSTATGDSNLLGLAVNGSVKFAIDAEGDIFGNNLILAGSTSAATTTITGDLKVEGNTTLGDVSTDTLTFNASTLSIPNNLNIDSNTLFIDASGNMVGIGTTTPTNILSLGNAAARKFWIENSATDVVGRALTVAAGGTVAGTAVSDVVGGNLILQAGLGTGTGASTISFQTGTTLTTGTTLQTMSTKMTILGSGNVGIGDATPAALLTVGSGDLFQVNSSGIIAAAAGITSSGTITFSGLTTAGPVITSAGGVFSSEAQLAISRGGTGQNWSAVTIGALPYFSGTGTMSTLEAGTANYLLMANGAAAPSWTNAINGVSIGATTPSSGAFTTLSASGATTLSSTLGVTGVTTLGNNLTFSGTTTRTITGPSTGGLTITVGSGPLTLSTTTSGTLSLTSAGALNLSAGAASIWTLPSVANALNIDSNTLTINALNDRVGIGMTGPNYTLDVSGDINFTGKLREDGNEILSGVIAAFAGSCPTGWIEYTAARGRTIVGTPLGGTNEGIVGAALGNLGTRTITDVASHLHTFTGNALPSHYHLMFKGGSGTTTIGWGSASYIYSQRELTGDADYKLSTAGANVANTGRTKSASAGTPSGTISTTGVASVDVTMPYIQLTYCQKSAGADLAEWISVSEDISAETIVSIDPHNREKIIAARKPYDPTVVGIISSEPGWLIGEEKSKSVQMALAGRVPTRVSLMNGEIKPGDPITTSFIPGVGMKATKTGPIVGKAMEALNETSSLIDCYNPITGINEKCGTILVFVNISWFNPENNQSQEDTVLAKSSGAYYELLRFEDDLTDGDLASLEYGEAPNQKDPSKLETVSYISKTRDYSSKTYVGVISNTISGKGDLLRRERVNNQIISETRLVFTGNTKVKISPSSESIQPGDFLSSSDEPGMAKKTTTAGLTIGKALEKWTPGSDKDKIMIFVNLGWYDPDVYLTSTEDIKILRNEGMNLGIVDTFVQEVKQALANLGLFIENGIAKVRRLIAEVVQLDKLEMRDQVTGEIYCTWIEQGEWVKQLGECQDVLINPEVQPSVDYGAGAGGGTSENQLESSENQLEEESVPEELPTGEQLTEELPTEEEIITEETVQEVVEEQSSAAEPVQEEVSEEPSEVEPSITEEPVIGDSVVAD